MADDEAEDLVDVDDQRTASRPSESAEEDGSRSTRGPGTDAATYERGARSFLELEDELADDGDARRARVVDAETVPAEAVPADYPRSIDGERALALTFEVDESGVDATAYFAWPPGNGGDLDRLLDVLGIPHSSFADLNGRRLLVTVEDGHAHPLVPSTPPRGTPYGVVGILGGQTVNVALLAAGVAGLVGPAALVLALLFVNLLALPAAAYLDASYLQSRTDWDHAPSMWALLHVPVGVNLLATAVYLRLRRHARPLSTGE